MRLMKTVLFVRNAFLDTPAFRTIETSLREAANRCGLQLLVRNNADFIGQDAFKGFPKACIFWDKDIRLAALLEQEGIRLYNSSQAIAVCDDKTLTDLALRGKVLMPETILCPMTYEGVGYGNAAFLHAVAERLGLPFVMKEGYGSYGQQVYLVQSVQEAQGLLERLANGPKLFQRFIAESAGRDVRVFVVGGRVAAAMERINETGDFRANAAKGSRTKPYMLSSEEEKMAIQACQVLGLDFAGVDLLFSKEGPVLCEVNSNAHFEALRATTNVNVAEDIMDWVQTTC